MLQSKWTRPTILPTRWWELHTTWALSFVKKSLTTTNQTFGRWGASCMSFAPTSTHLKQITKEPWYWKLWGVNLILYQQTILRGCSKWLKSYWKKIRKKGLALTKFSRWTQWRRGCVCMATVCKSTMTRFSSRKTRQQHQLRRKR